jgi:hypothetical protein
LPCTREVASTLIEKLFVGSRPVAFSTRLPLLFLFVPSKRRTYSTALFFSST